MKKYLKNTVFMIVVLLLTVWLIHVFSILTRPTTTDDAFDAFETFHEWPEESLDVIGFGSSHMWRSLQAAVMYEECQIEVYNYGCKWQHIDTSYLFLQDALQTQSPKLVLIECYLVDSGVYDTDINGEIYYTKALDDNQAKWAYLNDCFGESAANYLSYYVPLFGFHENWTDLTEKSFYKNSYQGDFAATRGYLSVTSANDVSPVDPETQEQEPLPERSIEILDDIVALCQENDIEILFYTAPYSGHYGSGDAMTAYAQENDCAYLDFFYLADEIGLDWDTDFSGSNHLNDNGSLKVTRYLGEYLLEHYDLT